MPPSALQLVPEGLYRCRHHRPARRDRLDRRRARCVARGPRGRSAAPDRHPRATIPGTGVLRHQRTPAGAVPQPGPPRPPRAMRVRRGNAHMRAAFSVRSSDKWAWLRDVAVPEPRLVPAAVPYLAITLAAHSSVTTPQPRFCLAIYAREGNHDQQRLNPRRSQSVLVTTLGIEDRAASIEAPTPLFGGLPELDSLAVLELATAIEDEFHITIDDEEFSGDIFETLGSLAAF